MDESHRPATPKTKRLTWLLSALFILALVMGPGPGLYLINGYAASGGMILGLPALYFWAVFWCAVEAGVVIAAYKLVWKNSSD